MTLQLKGLRTQLDPHGKRGLSYFKIGLRWLKDFLHKGRSLFSPTTLFSHDLQPCFASRKAKQHYYDAIWFSHIQKIKCHSH